RGLALSLLAAGLRPDRESASKADFTRVGFCVFPALCATWLYFLPDCHINIAVVRHWLFITPVSVHRLQIAILLKNSIYATSFFLTCRLYESCTHGRMHTATHARLHTCTHGRMHTATHAPRYACVHMSFILLFS